MNCVQSLPRGAAFVKAFYELRRMKDEGGRVKEEQAYPWDSPAADLAAAEKLIRDCGYHRRDQELADAKRAILGIAT